MPLECRNVPRFIIMVATRDRDGSRNVVWGGLNLCMCQR